MTLRGDIGILERWHLGKDAPDYYDVTVRIPIKTVSETNQREHHMARHRRRRQQRQTVAMVMIGQLRASGIKAPCAVHLTRCAPSVGLDGDNLVSSLKAVRDGVADALGVDDGDASVTWHYEQRRSKPREWCVEIRIAKVDRPPIGPISELNLTGAE